MTIFKILLFTVILLKSTSRASSGNEFSRLKCEGSDTQNVSEQHENLLALRREMQIHSTQHGPLIDAYILTSFDEHQTFQPVDSESRLQYISGFTGSFGYAAITQHKAALWVEDIYLELADSTLDCEWSIFSTSGIVTSIASWLSPQLKRDAIIGADPITPHFLWNDLQRDMHRNYLKLVKVKNLVDVIWMPRSKRDFPIKTHNSTYSGVKWQDKVSELKRHFKSFECDAMVVTEMTEIAYLLNLRGGDYRYTPVFLSYMTVSDHETVLYTNKSKISTEVELSLGFLLRENACFNIPCVIIKDLNEIWRDLRNQHWKRVLVPASNNFDVFEMGVSEQVYSHLNPDIILERVSPIIWMRAQKNEAEVEGMRRAHVKDAVAICDTLSYLEERYLAGDDPWTEATLAYEIDKSRYEQEKNRGPSYKTIVLQGKNAAKHFYYPPASSNGKITNQNLILVDSGSQYLEGTTAIARTIHLGEPTADEKRSYTRVLLGLIRLAMMAFPENLRASEIDIVLRGPLWKEKENYRHLSGFGIGSYLNAVESPINIAYTSKQRYTFKEGNFFTVSPGFQKPNGFGIRLKNVFEVVPDVSLSGEKFLRLQVSTLVPFETKLIDRMLLSRHEKKWLNQYNTRIRDVVGAELKKQFKMPAFYWMMNQTEHIREYLTEAEISHANISQQSHTMTVLFFVIFSSVLSYFSSISALALS